MTATSEKTLDTAFAGKPSTARRAPSAAAALSQDITALAVSLGTAVPANESYDPDPFVVALQRRHDELAEVAAKLREQNEAQRTLAAKLAAREAAVERRERQCAAFEKLQEASSAKGWRFW